jgi:hypothetical protein
MEALQPYKEHERKKRQRLLGEFSRLIREELHETLDTDQSPYDDISSMSMSLPQEIWDWLPPAPIRIPLWYMLPHRTPRNVPDIPHGCGHFLVGASMTETERESRGDSFPVYALPHLDATIDDIMTYIPTTNANTKQMIRYSGCTNVTTSGCFMIRGPLHSIHVSRPTSEVNTTFAKTFYAHPAQVYPVGQTGNVEEVTVMHTWEDGTIQRNRNVEAEFPSHPSDSQIKDSAWETTVYDPICIRVSCRDVNGLVHETSSRKRMSGFCIQEWNSV